MSDGMTELMKERVDGIPVWGAGVAVEWRSAVQEFNKKNGDLLAGKNVNGGWWLIGRKFHTVDVALLHWVDELSVKELCDGERYLARFVPMYAVNNSGLVFEWIDGSWISGGEVREKRPSPESQEWISECASECMQGEAQGIPEGIYAMGSSQVSESGVSLSQWADKRLGEPFSEDAKNIALMIDLETLATTAEAVVTEIGARFFNADTGKLLESFEAECCVDSQLHNGRVVSAATLDWYQQSGQEMAGLSRDEAMGLGEALAALSEWVQAVCEMRGIDVQQLKVWSKGAMDPAILDHAYHEVGYAVPWRYGNVRDLRTAIDESGVQLERAVVEHTAAADCDLQIEQLMQVRREQVTQKKLQELGCKAVDAIDQLREAREALKAAEDKLKLTNGHVVELQERLNRQEVRHESLKDARWNALRKQVQELLSDCEANSNDAYYTNLRHAYYTNLSHAYKGVLAMMDREEGK